MKIMTLGGGFISSHLPYSRILDRIDCSSKQIESILNAHKPDVLINCIGKTGINNTDWCESNKEITATTNSVIPILLADECIKKSIHLIHISSGCIFNGTPQTISEIGRIVEPGWKEDDNANPDSVYARSKYASDLILGKLNCTIIRPRMIISDKNHNHNLINKLRKYDKLIDVPNSVTFIDDLVRVISKCAKESQTGTFNATNPGTLTVARIMQEYQKYFFDHKFELITSEDLNKLTLAKRSNCILNTKKLYHAGFYMQNAEEALIETMAKYVSNM